jgi:hypothetical protein
LPKERLVVVVCCDDDGKKEEDISLSSGSDFSLQKMKVSVARHHSTTI